MRILFMGTPDFAVASLRALVEAGHEICVVFDPTGFREMLCEFSLRHADNLRILIEDDSAIAGCVRRCNGPYFDVQTHRGLVVLFSEQDSDEVFGFLAGEALIRIGDDGKAIQ